MQKEIPGAFGQAIFDRRREVLPGYPWTGHFESQTELDHYLSGEKVCCLLCGKLYAQLGSHLKVHGTDMEDYKKRFAIPPGCTIEGAAQILGRRERCTLKPMSHEDAVQAGTKGAKVAVAKKSASNRVRITKDKIKNAVSGRRRVPRPKVTDEIIRYIRAHPGETNKEIGAKFQLSVGTINSHRPLDWKNPKHTGGAPPVDRAVLAEIRAMVFAMPDVKLSEIASAYGFSRMVVSKALNRT